MKALLLFALALLKPASAQTSFLYKWAFNDKTIQDTVPACTPLAITISSFDTTKNATKGTPPYYMVTLGIDGPVSTQLIGVSDNDVSFTLDHAPDTRVLLEVFDANGNPGGTFAPMIVTGDKTSCVVDRTSASFTFTHNITGELSTCDPLGLAITGGVSPYTVSLIAANSPSVTNVTMPEGDNLYTYISRAAPGGQLVVGISDAKGKWASGTALFATKGSTDTDCPGLLSSSSKTVLSLPSSTPATSGSASAPLTAPGVTTIQSNTPTGSSASPAATPSTPGNSGQFLRATATPFFVAIGLTIWSLV